MFTFLTIVGAAALVLNNVFEQTWQWWFIYKGVEISKEGTAGPGHTCIKSLKCITPPPGLVVM